MKKEHHCLLSRSSSVQFVSQKTNLSTHRQPRWLSRWCLFAFVGLNLWGTGHWRVETHKVERRRQVWADWANVAATKINRKCLISVNECSNTNWFTLFFKWRNENIPGLSGASLIEGGGSIIPASRSSWGLSSGIPFPPRLRHKHSLAV